MDNGTGVQKPKVQPKFKGEAVQVVTLEGPKNNRKLRLQTKVLRSITHEARDYNIAVIAIAGPALGGKSFILTHIVRYLQALEKAKNGDVGDWLERNNPDKSMDGHGFRFRNGTARTTEGIWMWSRPFFVKPSPEREPIAILVIDTEGCFGSTVSEKDQSSIVGLSLLASSCFIYNESTTINEHTLMALAKFVQYGQIATQSFDVKSFQRLMILVRDWNMSNVHPYGAAGGQEFMKNSMVPKATMSSEAIECRQSILKSFEYHDAYLMPHPGEDALSADFRGSIGELSTRFLHHLEGFVLALVDGVDIKKKVSNSPINGPSFYNLFESYVSAFNSDNLPSPTSIFKANLFVRFETILSRQVSAYQNEFQEKLRSSEVAVQPLEDLQKWHKTISGKVVQAFAQRTQSIGSDEEKALFAQKLQIDLDNFFHQFRTTYEEKRNELIKSSGIKAFAKFSEYLDSLPSEIILTESDLNRCVSKTESNCKLKFLKSCTGVSEEFIKTQQILFDTKLQELKSNYWTTLFSKRKSLEVKLSKILHNIETDYDTLMSEEINKKIVTEESLKTLHERQISNAVRTYEAKVTRISAAHFVQTFQEELKTRLNSKFEVVKNKNQFQLQTLQEIIRSDIDEAASNLREEFNVLRPQTLSPDFGEFDKQYEISLEIALKRFEQLQPSKLGMKVQVECIRRLERSLRDVVDEAKHAMESKAENHEHTILAESPDQVRDFSYENQQVTDADQQKLKLENLERMKDSELRVSKIVGDFSKRYKKQMEIYQSQESPSLDELSENHNKLCTYLTARKSPLDCMCSNEECITSYERKLTSELEDAFKYVRDLAESKLTIKRKQREEFLEEMVSNFEQKIKPRINANPFINRRQYENVVDEAELNCEAAINNNSFSSHEKRIKRELLRTFSTKIKARKEELEDFRSESFIKGKVKIREAVESTFKEAEKIIELRIASPSTQNYSLLQSEILHSMEEIKTYFDNCWKLCHGDREEAWTEVEIRAGPLIQRLKDTYDKIYEKKKQALADGRRSFDTTISALSNEINSGKFYTTQSLDATLEKEVQMAKKQVHQYYSQNNMNQTEIDQREYSDNLNAQALALKQHNQENETNAMSEIKDNCKKLFRQQKHSCNNAQDLLKLKKEVVQRSLSLLRSKFVEKSSRYPQLQTEIQEFCDAVHQDISRDKREAVNSEIIMRQAVVEYCTEMDEKVEKVTLKDAKELVGLHKQVVKKIIMDIKSKNFISEDLEKPIEFRLRNSCMIYVNKHILRNTVNNVAVGIHLGTTCGIAIHRGDKVEVIRDNAGNAHIPSYVCFHEVGEPPVGSAAKNESHLNPENTIFDAQRLIGRSFSDQTVQNCIKMLPFKVVKRKGKPKIVVHNNEYGPEDISAYVLKHVKCLASAKLGFEVKKAVITVPANFDERQRDATRQAAQIAGLEVLQILNEPTAAAMAYKLNDCHEDKHILVFDFGGGSLEVTILKASGADLQILTTMGDPHLGGEDCNMVLHCADKFEVQHGIKLLKVDQRNDAKEVNRRMKRLRNYCEDAKATLSVAESATVNIDAITKDGLDLSVTITKSEFESMNGHLFQKSIDIVADAIKKAGVRPGEIDEVLMIGGSSRIPKVKAMLQNFLGARSLILDEAVDVQEAVALGAATQACLLAGGLAEVMVDDSVTPFSAVKCLRGLSKILWTILSTLLLCLFIIVRIVRATVLLIRFCSGNAPHGFRKSLKIILSVLVCLFAVFIVLKL